MPKKKKRIKRLYNRIKRIKRKQELRKMHRLLKKQGFSYFLKRQKYLKRKRYNKLKFSINKKQINKVRSLAKYFLSRAVAKRQRRRKKKGLIYLRLVMTQTVLTMTHFRLIHTLRKKRRRYKSKSRRIRSKKKRHSRKIKKLYKKILYYPDRIKQPVWISKKVCFLNSLYKTYKLRETKLVASNNISRKSKMPLNFKKRTFNYNNHSCMFKNKKKIKKYRKIILKKTIMNYPDYVKIARNVIWKLLLKLRYMNKRLRKKIKRIRFKKRMLIRCKRHYKYRKNKLYKKGNKRFFFKKKQNKKISYKKIPKINMLIKSLKSKRRIKLKKMIYSLRTLEYRLYGLKRKLKRILHVLKKTLISKNDIITRVHVKTRGKKNRKMFYLNTLPIYKTDIKSSYCLRLLSTPELFKRLILTI